MARGFNEDGSFIVAEKDLLKTSDGKQLVTSNSLPEWCILNQCGKGDSPTEINGGSAFMLASDDPNTDDILEFNFIDPVYVTSGVGVVKNAQLGDWIRFEVFAPPTVGEAAPNLDGNCHKYPTGLGFDIFIPAPGNGSWRVDLASADCHLVPNPGWAGFWNWEMPKVGVGTINPSYTMAGEFDLYSIGMRLSMFASDVPILGTDVVLKFGIENVRAKMIPPHWHWLVTLHCANAGHEAQVAFLLQMGRARTYLPQHIPMVP